MNYLPNDLRVHPLDGGDGLQPSVHVFDDDSILAINAAIAAKRPLLLRGEPGAGKTQLARAAASVLDRNFRSRAVDASTDAGDLLWRVDAVTRLGTAQTMASLAAKADAALVRETLDESRFLHPGPLWWGFDWESASKQAEHVGGLSTPSVRRGGVVVLIDEIDKADRAVPNGLLDALGGGSFDAPGGRRVERHGDPLVILTTNEERSLPDAFLRRCLVHVMTLPRETSLLVEWLTERGRAHFDAIDDAVLLQAAQQIAGDRQRLVDAQLAAPGLAEYLDLLRAVDALAAETGESHAELVAKLARFVCRKHAAPGIE